MADQKKIDDRKIIKQILEENDAEAYRLLVERYQQGLIHHLYAMVGDQMTAEDLAQEAFIRAYNKLKRYDPTYAFSTWLYRIATNLSYTHLKKKKSLPLFDVDRHESDEDVVETVMRNEAKEKVQRHVRGLPHKYRTVVSLHYWHGQSYEEMAKTVDVPIGTIKTWLHRAKALLKEELAEYELQTASGEESG